MWTNIRSQFGDFTNSTNFVKDKKQNEKNWIKMPFVCCYTFHSFWKLHSSYRESYRFWYEKNSWFWVDYNKIWFFIGKYMKGKKQSIFLFVSLQFGFNFQEYSFWCNWLAHDSAQQWSHILYFSYIIPVLFSKSESIKST